jgi:hypothetical protein
MLKIIVFIFLFIKTVFSQVDTLVVATTVAPEVPVHHVIKKILKQISLKMDVPLVLKAIPAKRSTVIKACSLI